MTFFRPFLLAVSFVMLTAHAQAAGLIHEVKVGVLDHDTGGLWSGFNRESGTDSNLEFILSPSTSFLGGDIRPAIGVSFNSDGDTSKAYGAARWETTVGGAGFFALGVGLAAHNGETDYVASDRKALGSKVLFYFPIEAGLRFQNGNSMSIFFDHVSNAWLASPNEGMDTLGIRYGFQF